MGVVVSVHSSLILTQPPTCAVAKMEREGDPASGCHHSGKNIYIISVCVMFAEG